LQARQRVQRRDAAELLPGPGRPLVAESISRRKLEPQEGQATSSRALSLTTSMGLRQCGQRMCMAAPHADAAAAGILALAHRDCKGVPAVPATFRAVAPG
jgi:hypothetical protein